MLSDAELEIRNIIQELKTALPQERPALHLQLRMARAKREAEALRAQRRRVGRKRKR